MANEYGLVPAAPEKTSLNAAVCTLMVEQLLDFGHFASYVPDGPLEIIVAREQWRALGVRRQLVEQFLLGPDGHVRSAARRTALTLGRYTLPGGWTLDFQSRTVALALDETTGHPVLVDEAYQLPHGGPGLGPVPDFYDRVRYAPAIDHWGYEYQPGFLPVRDSAPLPLARRLLADDLTAA